ISAIHKRTIVCSDRLPPSDTEHDGEDIHELGDTPTNESRNHILYSSASGSDFRSAPFRIDVDARCGLQRSQLANARKTIAPLGGRNPGRPDMNHHQSLPHKVCCRPTNIDGAHPRAPVVFVMSTPEHWETVD